MERWFGIALIVVFLWGLGSFFGKLALIRDIPYRVYLFEGIGTLVILVLFVFFKRGDIFANLSFNTYALLMGVCWGIGTIFFIIALQPAKLSVIVPLTALYPTVTVLLSLLFLQERLELREIIGIVLAVLSIALLAK
jgi:transporter family protein